MFTREEVQENIRKLIALTTFGTEEVDYWQQYLVNQPPTFAISHEVSSPETTVLNDWREYEKNLEEQNQRGEYLAKNMINIIAFKRMDIKYKIYNKIRSYEFENNAIGELQAQEEVQNAINARLKYSAGSTQNAILRTLINNQYTQVSPLNTDVHVSDVPIIQGIADLNELSGQTIERLLTAYALPITGNAKSKKRAIARALGMVSVADERYSFNNTYGSK